MNGGRQEDRGPPRIRVQPMVQRLIDNAPSYEPRARVDDDLCINEIVMAKRQQPGAASALHAKWQEEGYVDRLSRDDCEQLSRAGYKVNKDRDGFWAWWREKRLSHLWLVVGPGGWQSTRAPHPKGAQWKLVGSVYQPILPYFEDYEVTPQTIIREGLILALTTIKEDVPDRIFGEKFFAVVKELCDEAVQSVNADQAWFDDILQQVPTVSPMSEDQQGDGGEIDYTGGVVKS